MTTLAPPPVEPTPPPTDEVAAPVALPAALDTPAVEEAEATSLNRVAVVVGLACLAAAWLVSRIFVDQGFALFAAVLGAGIGLGLCRFAETTARPWVAQYAALPLSVLAGVALVAPGLHSGASVVGAVQDALQQGGLSRAPVSFDPGWRLLVVVLFAGLAAVTFLVATARATPRLGAVLPLPVVLGAVLLQPKGSEALLSIPFGLLLAALAVAAGADIRRSDQARSFEMRRLARGGALLLALMVGVVGLTQLGFLFPDTATSQVIPAQRPPTPPPLPDKPLFSVRAGIPGPWRVGVLEAQDAEGYFLLPPVDPAATVTLARDGKVPQDIQGPSQQATFTVEALPGHEIPVPDSVRRVDGISGHLQWDPRSGSLRLPDQLVQGVSSYTVTYAVPPSAKQMSAAPAPEPAIASLYEQVAPPPAAVQRLLSSAPLSGFDRLQYVRQSLYNSVVASGGGQPVAVTPHSVAAMLGGGQATRYEITAAEVMLARWAGFPARLGFGFYGGDQLRTSEGPGGQSLTTYQVHPTDATAWLEVYFRGYGWVPIVGTPPRAVANLDNNKKTSAPTTQSDQLALQVYVPIRVHNLLPLYEITRYWVLVMLPVVIGIVLVVAFYPGVLKLLRGLRRRRWASRAGLLPQLVVAYAEFRDRCHDLNVGDTSWTPMQFIRALERDDEHLELASLYTRGVWGDISRDLRDEDVRSAHEMAASLARRLARRQPVVNRVLAFASRASLRDPYTDEIPNLWPRLRLRRHLRVPVIRHRRLVLRPVAAVMALVVVIGATLGVAAGVAAAARVPAPDYPARIAPEQVLEYRVQREPAVEALFRKPGADAAVTGGRVYTFSDSVTTEGSLQVSAFAPDIDSHDTAEQQQIEQQIGVGAFRTVLFGPVRLLQGFGNGVQFVLWFPPEHAVMELFVFRTQVKDVESVVRHVIAYQRGLALPDQDLLSSTAVAPGGPSQ